MSEESKSNRRDFLSGKSALDSVRSKLESSVDAFEIRPESIDRQSAYLEQFVKNAMACEFEISFNLHQYKQAGPAAMAAFQLIDRLESQMTVYRDDSEVSLINRTAGGGPIKVEADLFGLLQASVEIFDLTNGAFDITAGALSSVWGFDERSPSIPDDEELAESLAFVGSQKLKLDSTSNTLSVPPNMKINFGGIGKGFALDRVGELFRSKAVNDFLVHGGQSSVLAFGSSVVEQMETPTTMSQDDCPDVETNETVPSKARGWPIGITHPTIPAQRLGQVELFNEALGTSGTARQGFYHQGKRYGHIIDPRTGWPSNRFLSTTVIAPSAAVADALATAFFVMEPEQIEAICNSNPEIRAVLVLASEKVSGHVEVKTFNLDDRWTPVGE